MSSTSQILRAELEQGTSNSLGIKGKGDRGKKKKKKEKEKKDRATKMSLQKVITATLQS